MASASHSDGVPGTTDSSAAPDPLAESGSDLLQKAIDQAPDSIVVADLTGRIRYANAAAGRYVRRPGGELVGRHFLVALAPGDDGSRYAEISRVVGERGVWSGSYRDTAPDGSPGTVDLVVSPVLDETGAVVSVLAIGREMGRRRTIDADAAREARRRGEIVAELARLDATEEIASRARRIGEVLLGLDAVAFSEVIAFGSAGTAEVVASSGSGTLPDSAP